MLNPSTLDRMALKAAEALRAARAHQIQSVHVWPDQTVTVFCRCQWQSSRNSQHAAGREHDAHRQTEVTK